MQILPIGSEKWEILGVGSIPVAKLPCSQHMKVIALELHNMNVVWE